MPKAKKLRAGRGAEASILTRFIKPPQPWAFKDQRSNVILKEKIEEGGKIFYTFHFLDGDGGETESMRASFRYCKVMKEGPPSQYFDGNKDDEEGEGKVKWRDSKARKLLHRDILNGTIPLHAGDESGSATMELKEIYILRPEFAAYDYGKFSSRLSAIRRAVKDCMTRADDDAEALASFIALHDVSYYCRKGYIQWKGSDARQLALNDIKNKAHDLTIRGGKDRKGGFRSFYESREEYYGNFPFKEFCDKIRQEIKTSKYIHTLEVKGKQHRSS